MKNTYSEMISIIVPVYNVEIYLKRCVESIVNQTYTNLEIILVDDGSTDNSGFICDEYARKDRRIKVIHKINGGLSDARNYGLKSANGKYIGFIDSDDWVEVDMYETLYKMLTEYDADIAMCGANSVDDNKKLVPSGNEVKIIYGYDDIVLYEKDQIMEAHLKMSNDINAGVWNKLYKRDIVKDIKFPVGKLYEDVFTTYKYLNKASRLVKTKSHKYNYFQRHDSIINSKFTERNFDSFQANSERYNFIRSNYPNLEQLARTRFLVDILNVAVRLEKSGLMIKYTEELKRNLDKTKNMQLKNTELTFKQKIGLVLLRKNIKLFSVLTHVIYGS